MGLVLIVNQAVLIYLMVSWIRTGLCFEVEESSAKDFWKAVYGDIESIIAMKEYWTKDLDNEGEGA
jgi:hypothetical protein